MLIYCAVLLKIDFDEKVKIFVYFTNYCLFLKLIITYNLDKWKYILLYVKLLLNSNFQENKVKSFKESLDLKNNKCIYIYK